MEMIAHWFTLECREQTYANMKPHNAYQYACAVIQGSLSLDTGKWKGDLKMLCKYRDDAKGIVFA